MPRPASAARRGTCPGRLGASRMDSHQYDSHIPVARSGGGVCDGACEAVLPQLGSPGQLPPLSQWDHALTCEAQLSHPRPLLHHRVARERPPRRSADRLCAYDGAFWRTSSSGVEPPLQSRHRSPSHRIRFRLHLRSSRTHASICGPWSRSGAPLDCF